MGEVYSQSQARAKNSGIRKTGRTLHAGLDDSRIALTDKGKQS